MIDSFDFGSWCGLEVSNAECAETFAWDEALGSFWPFVGNASFTESVTDASAGTWVWTILGIISVVLAFAGWFYFETKRTQRAADRVRASGRWSAET